MRMLVLRQRDAGGTHAMVFGRPQQQSAPAGADIQEALARAQHQLAADVLQLGLLGLRQRHVRAAVVGAGIDPARVQPQRVEVVRHVVVELHLARVDLGAMALERLAAVHQLAPPGQRPRRLVRARRVVANQPRRHIDDLAHRALDVDAAFDIVLCQSAHLPGRHMGQRQQAGQAQRHRRNVRPDASSTGQHQRQRRSVGGGQGTQALGDEQFNCRHGGQVEVEAPTLQNPGEITRRARASALTRLSR